MAPHQQTVANPTQLQAAPTDEPAQYLLLEAGGDPLPLPFRLVDTALGIEVWGVPQDRLELAWDELGERLCEPAAYKSEDDAWERLGQIVIGPDQYGVGFVPVPEWDGRQWLPTDPRRYGGEQLIPWPVGLDPDTLPHPPYALQQKVVVKNYLGKLVPCTVRRIRLQGGWYKLPGQTEPALRAAQQWYKLETMTVLLEHNGHLSWDPLAAIMGPDLNES